jgi:predicted dehydrogenase
VVAIAEPRPQTRALFAHRYGVDDSLVFETWEQFHKASAESIQTIGKRLADTVIIAVHDRMHAELVVAFAAQGYDILCEKPMATSIEHCLQIEAAVKKAGIVFGMGHGVFASLPHVQCMPLSPKILNKKMCQCCDIRPILLP